MNERIDTRRIDSGWRLLAVNGKQERLARFHLERAGLEVYLPMRLIVHRGQSSARPFFPGYLFVHVTEATSWLTILSTIGVKSVVGRGGGEPAPLPLSVVDAMRRREVEGFIPLDPVPDAPCGFEAGQKVRLGVGRFGATLDAVFEERVDKDRCRLLITFIGRESARVVPLAHVAALGQAS